MLKSPFSFAQRMTGIHIVLTFSDIKNGKLSEFPDIRNETIKGLSDYLHVLKILGVTITNFPLPIFAYMFVHMYI